MAMQVDMPATQPPSLLQAGSAATSSMSSPHIANGNGRMASISSIPAEVMDQILKSCDPRDLSALAQTCKSLYSYLRDALHIWNHVYSRIWDPPQLVQGRLRRHDALITLPTPSISAKGKEVQGSEGPGGCHRGTFLFGAPLHRAGCSAPSSSPKIYIEEHLYPPSCSFDVRQQMQRRIWAENQIRRLKAQPFRVLANYNEVMQALLSIARSRSRREAESSKEGEDAVNAQYLESLLGGTDDGDAFRRLVYPRHDVSRLREWQLINAEKDYEDGQRANAQKRRQDSLKRAHSSSSSIPEKRQKGKTPSKKDVPKRTRRRSARLMLSAYPPHLQHLLRDESGDVLIEEGEALRLEDLGAIDEQLAAELHVLHGILPARRREAPEIRQTTVDLTEEDGDDSDEDGVTLLQTDDVPSDALRDDIRLRRRAFVRADRSDEFGDAHLRARAREIVYDTARYGPENDFGPLKAWRTRRPSIDGERETYSDQDDDDEEDSASFAGSDTESDEDEDEDDDVIVVSDVTNGEDRTVALPHHDDPQVIDLTHLTDDNASDDDIDEADDDFDPDNADLEDLEALEHLYNGARETHMRLSRGMLPWLESERLRTLALDHSLFAGNGGTQKPSSNDEESRNHWQADKRVDWIVVEAIMVVMFCNIRRATTDNWGHSFHLPGQERSLTGRDAYARRILEDLPWSPWKDVLGLPCGWDHSREDALQHAAGHHSSRFGVKTYDWAKVESTWIGTYAFLDWSTWSVYNSRDPHLRGHPLTSGSEEAPEYNPTRPMPRGTSSNDIASLKYEREAVGDCLQLQLELLPPEEQGWSKDPPTDDDDMQWYDAEGHYPPLKFRGQTVTFLDEDEPNIRGQVHGVVKPIYAPRCADYDRERDGPRAIIAAHWELTHRYDGEDRWSLSGIQPGPPGSRAPIYGIWGTSDRQDNTSPCGPFAYYLVDERPWKHVQELLNDEARASMRRSTR